MACRFLWGPWVLAGAAIVSYACGGDAFTTKSGDGDGDGDVGDGDGPIINFGIEGRCETNEDCVSVAVTWDACYSPSCSSPYAASLDDVNEDACLVLWSSGEGPEPTEECRNQPDGDVSCPLACAVSPVCTVVTCDDGTCALRSGSEPADCEPSGGTGGSGAGTGGGSSSSCDDLDEHRANTLESARSCVPGGIVPECVLGETLPNECGCPVVVNEARPDDIEAAKDAHSAWNEACEPPEYCQGVDCAPPPTPTSCGDSGLCE